MFEKSPEVLINGEHASEDEVSIMETLARRLLKPIPADYNSFHSCISSDGDTVVQFSTQSFEEELGEGEYAYFTLKNNLTDNHLFIANFGYDNSVNYLNLTDRHAIKDIENAFDNLLNNTALQSDERLVIEFMQSIILRIQGLSRFNYNETPRLMTDLGEEFAGNIIRRLVHQNANTILVSKGIQDVITEDGSTIELALSDTYDKEGKLLTPELMIEYIDTANRIVYRYKRKGNYRHLESWPTDIESLSQTDVEQEENEDIYDSLLTEYIEEIGATMPGKHDVNILYAVLQAISSSNTYQW